MFLRPFGLYGCWYVKSVNSEKTKRTTTAALSANPTPTSTKAKAAWPLGNAAETAADGRGCRRMSSALKLGPFSQGSTSLQKSMQVYRHQGGSPTTRLTLRRAGNLSEGHQDTRKILKRKKRTDTFYTSPLNLSIILTYFCFSTLCLSFKSCNKL